MKRIISFVLVFCIVITCGIAAYAEKTDEASATDEVAVQDNDITVENEKFCLSLNTETFLIKVLDKRNEFVWSSNFTDNSQDSVAAGVVKTDMLSSVIVKYVYQNTTKTVNSCVGSVRKNGASVKEIKNGFCVTYNFKEQGFIIPVEYVLEKDGLKASVVLSDVKENSENQILNIELFPFFGGEQSKGVEGYVFVPDGSGAIISFDNKQSGIKQIYEKKVYGEDLMTPVNIETTYNKDIKIPVFGMKTGNNAFVSIIESGADNSYICASATGQLIDGATVSSKYVYRANGNVDVTMQNGSKTTSLFMTEPNTDTKKYTVKYSFLVDDKADYVGMAEVYRKYLTDNGLKDTSKGEAELFLDLYGGLLKQTNFLGIPYKTTEVLTSFKEAKSIVKKFKDKGVGNISLGLKNYTNSAIKEMPQIEFNFVSKLGGQKGYKELVAFAKENDVNVYSFADFFSFAKKGNGIGSNKTKVYSLQKAPLRLKNFSLKDNYRVDNSAPLSFVRPTKYEYAAKKLIKNAKKSKVEGIGLGDIASALISDNSKSYTSRGNAKKLLLAAVKKIDTEYSITSYCANDYIWKYSDKLTDIPTSSSKYIIFAYDIPFLQVVLKGIKDYSAESLNLSAMSTESFLKVIESGSNLKFEGIYAENSKINGTGLGDVFAANYESWFDVSLEWYKETQKVYSAVKDSKICEHSADGELSKTVYENGVTVYVNYSGSDIEADGITVPALWYTLKEGN